MRTPGRTAAVLILPAVAWLGAACERTETPTGALPPPVMQMADGSRTFTNDFENPGDDTPAGDWFVFLPPATITRTPSGAAATYASGIPSASGNWHARLRHNVVTGCPKVQASFACTGPFTRWGKGASSFNPVFPDGGYVTEIDIYLDVAWMAADPTTRFDTRFDWSSAINNQLGTFRRDFVFNAGTPLTTGETGLSPGYYVNASTNAFRSGAFPQNDCPNPSTFPNSCRTPVKIDQSGWYVFQHYFHLTTIGGNTYLAVDMSVRQLNGTIVASWTIYDQEDAQGFGGDRYGWFVINEIQDLAADCSTLHPPGKTPGGRTCPSPAPSMVTGGGQVPVNMPAGVASFGFNAKQGTQSGHLNYLNHATRTQLDCTVNTVTITSTTDATLSGTCSSKTYMGTFTARVVDGGTPGKGNDEFRISYGLVMNEGGTLTSGNIQIH